MSKLEPFDGNYYKRWFEHMLFYLEAIRVNYVLFEDCVPANMAESAHFASALIYEKDNHICRGHILHYLSNSLFDIYCSYKFAKEIWEALKKKYSIEDAGTKKYVVDAFQAATLIEKLPPSWKEYINYLKHKKRDMSLKDLIVHI
ncbi:hypothetical protein ACB092_11G072200 [Castanea dentata]